VESVKNAYLLLAAKTDKVPDGVNYRFDNEKAAWILDEKKPE
jgi:hypothetical protein